MALSSGQTAAADSTTSHRKFFVNTIFCDDCVIQFDEKTVSSRSMPLRYMYKKLCKGGSIYMEECVAYIFFLYMAAVPVSFFSLLLLSGSIHMCANQRSKRKKKNVVSQNIFLNLLFFAKARHFD